MKSWYKKSFLFFIFFLFFFQISAASGDSELFHVSSDSDLSEADPCDRYGGKVIPLKRLGAEDPAYVSSSLQRLDPRVAMAATTPDRRVSAYHPQESSPYGSLGNSSDDSPVLKKSKKSPIDLFIEFTNNLEGLDVAARRPMEILIWAEQALYSFTRKYPEVGLEKKELLSFLFGKDQIGLSIVLSFLDSFSQ